MSRIGRQPIEIPPGVNVSLLPGRVMVNGPLGELTQQVPARMKVEQANVTITTSAQTDEHALALLQALGLPFAEGDRRND